MTAPTVLIAGTEYPHMLPTRLAAELLDTSEEQLQKAARGEATLPAGLVPRKLNKRLRWPALQVAAVAGLPAEIRTNGTNDQDPPVANEP